MSGQERQILQDIFMVTACAAAVAGIVFGVIRGRYPLLGWNTHGNVWTSPFGVAEMLISGLVFYIAWLAIGAVPEEVPPPTVDSVMQGSLFFCGIAGMVVLYFWRVRRLEIRELFGLDRLRGWKLFGIGTAWFVPAALAGFATKFGFDQFVWRAAGLNLEDQTLVTALMNGSAALKGAIFVSAVIVAPVAEEILFRGLLYATAKRYSERYFAAVFSSLAFGLVHANLASFAPLVVLGMLFALAYEITGCLAVPMLMHALFNAFSVALILNA